MRIGLIADIHGNTAALDAVLADMGAVDVLACLGDIAAGGPDPGGAIDRIAELECVSVQGNTDAGMVDVPAWWRAPDLIGLTDVARPGMEICVWGADRINAAQRDFLDGLPLTAEVDLGNAGSLLAFHGSPRSFDDYFTATTPDDDLAPLFTGTDHAVLAGGHTHVPLLRRYRTQTLVNPGSVGMPFAEYGFAGSVAVLAHAAYGLVTVEGGNTSIELRTVIVDQQRVEQLVAQHAMPNGTWWLGLRTRA